MNNPDDQNEPLPENPDLEPAPVSDEPFMEPSPLELALIQISDLQQHLAATKDQALRALADADNTRKRAVKDREEASKYAVSNFARDLLDYTDNFKRAIDAIPEDLKTSGDDRITNLLTGLEAMQRQFHQTLEKNGIRKITPRDEPFNPHFHEVMFEVPGTGKAPGMIVQLVDAGYVIHDRLLRPARVGVAKDEGQGHQVDTQA